MQESSGIQPKQSICYHNFDYYNPDTVYILTWIMVQNKTPNVWDGVTNPVPLKTVNGGMRYHLSALQFNLENQLGAKFHTSPWVSCLIRFIHTHPFGGEENRSMVLWKIWTKNSSESLLIRTMAIICEWLFVFKIQGSIECRKCRSNFLPRPDFPQIPCPTEFSRLKIYFITIAVQYSEFDIYFAYANTIHRSISDECCLYC